MRVGFVCGGRALRAHRRLAGSWPRAARLLSVSRRSCRPAIERLQADAKEPKRPDQGSASQGSRSTKRPASPPPRRRVVVVAALEGWDQNGAEDHRRRPSPRRPGHVAALVGVPAPSAVVIARSTDRADRLWRGAEAARGPVRRQGRRPAGTGPGRRAAGRSGGDRRTTCASCSEASRSTGRPRAPRPRSGRPSLS